MRASVGFFCLILTAFDQADATVADKARAFVEMLRKAEYAAAVMDFDEAVLNAMPADKLRETWELVQKQVGPFKKQVEVKVTKAGKHDIADVTCDFEKMQLDVRVSFNDKRQIAGLFFKPTKDPAAEYAYPTYVKPGSFVEQSVSVGNEPYLLPGTLSVPNGEGPFPALVLVHGSGPHDRDEAIGPNKPFKDIAGGLASRGIAVLRYVKRTKQHGMKMMSEKGSLTVKEEVEDDALAAAALLRASPKIDPKRVFVLGHSLGGICIPRIGSRDPQLAGLICLAGCSRPLEDVIIDQAEYILSLEKDPQSEAAKLLQKMKEDVLWMKKEGVTAETPSAKLPLSMPAAYWMDLRAYKATEVAKTLKQPLLILQGERDYQVTMTDFMLWKAELAEKSNVEYRSFPKLNHLFMEGEGKAKPAEYGVKGHVSEELIDVLARWIVKK